PRVGLLLVLLVMIVRLLVVGDRDPAALGEQVLLGGLARGDQAVGVRQERRLELVDRADRVRADLAVRGARIHAALLEPDLHGADVFGVVDAAAADRLLDVVLGRGRRGRLLRVFVVVLLGLAALARAAERIVAVHVIHLRLDLGGVVVADLLTGLVRERADHRG